MNNKIHVFCCTEFNMHNADDLSEKQGIINQRLQKNLFRRGKKWDEVEADIFDIYNNSDNCSSNDNRFF